MAAPSFVDVRCERLSAEPCTPEWVRAYMRDASVTKEAKLALLASLVMSAKYASGAEMHTKFVAAFRAGSRELLTPRRRVPKRRVRATRA